MLLTVASLKGGVGKTTTAVHLAGVLAERGPTLLVDLDYNQSALGWAQSGRLPYRVADLHEARGSLENFDHVVIDTGARPEKAELERIAGRGDVIVLPTTPDALAVRALTQTVRMLRQADSRPFKILLTIVPPYPSKEGARAREALEEAGLDVLKAQIPRTSAFQHAALEGKLVHEITHAKSIPAWFAYEAAGRELLE